MNKELEELIRLAEQYPYLDKKELVRYVHLQSVFESKLERLGNYEQNEDFSKDVLNYAFLNEQDKIKKLKALDVVKEIAKVYDIDFCDKDQTMSFKIRLRNKFVLETIRFKSKEEYDLLKEVLI